MLGERIIEQTAMLDLYDSVSTPGSLILGRDCSVLYLGLLLQTDSLLN